MKMGGIRHENQDDRIWNHIFDTWTSAIGQMFFFEFTIVNGLIFQIKDLIGVPQKRGDPMTGWRGS